MSNQYTQTKALDVQMLIDTPSLQLTASNDMDPSTTVSRYYVTLDLNANLDRQRKSELNIITTLSVGKDIDSSRKYQYCPLPSSQYVPLLVLCKFCDRNQNLIYHCCVVIPISVYIMYRSYFTITIASNMMLPSFRRKN